MFDLKNVGQGDGSDYSWMDTTQEAVAIAGAPEIDKTKVATPDIETDETDMVTAYFDIGDTAIDAFRRERAEAASTGGGDSSGVSESTRSSSVHGPDDGGLSTGGPSGGGPSGPSSSTPSPSPDGGDPDSSRSSAPIDTDKPKSLQELTLVDALKDPLQAFAYACNPSLYQDKKMGVANFKLAMFCGNASASLGHRMTDRELLYAVIGRNVDGATTPAEKVEAGKVIVVQSVVQRAVWNATEQAFKRGGLGEMIESFKTDLNKGVKWTGKEMEFTGLAKEILEHKKGDLKLVVGDEEVLLDEKGVQSIKATLVSAKEFAMNKEIDKMKLEEILPRLGYIEGWSNNAIESAGKLLKATSYDNGLMKGSFSYFKGSFSYFRGLCADFVSFIGRGSAAWRV